jgi:hypothetical protein
LSIDIDDINRSLKIIKSSIQEKCSVKDLDLYTKEQALVNEFLCAENVVGRWRWRSGNLQNKTLVPWEEQTMNTLTDNFIWEKNDTFITVQVSGLYEVGLKLI